ncbi:MAG TPA: SAM-dependent methyltransferase [Xanthobacteraceae bacterium]|nr:SAM-dependent methyltransferase [Xanthobacteraceae bacterium]
MISIRRVAEFAIALSVVALAFNASAQDSAATKKPYEPVPGQPGKDSVWVPTPFVTLEKMYDLAKLTPKDFAMDLGSGDGRSIIVAAKRGAPGLGIEWNPDLIELSNKLAKEAGVSHLAKFERGDMFAADLSKATVLGLFMLPDQLAKLTPKFLGMRPGSRITMNGFAIPGWTIDVTEKATGDCGTWCTAHLYIVPAPVAGTWRLGEADLALTQSFQMITGTLTANGKATPIAAGRLNGEEITFTVGDAKYTGRVNGSAISGEVNGKPWSATKK